MHQIRINVYRHGSTWFAARWIDGDYDGCDELDIDDDASPFAAVAAAEAMALNVDGERAVALV
jgi:hypothetical protein